MDFERLYALCDQKEGLASLYVAEAIEDALANMDFHIIDQWFLDVDFTRIIKDVAFSFIAFTNVAKHHYKFKNRPRFIEECERRWQYSEGLMEKYK